MSVRPSVPSYFRMPIMAVFKGEKSLTDIVNNSTMSDDEVVASDVPSCFSSKRALPALVLKGDELL